MELIKINEMMADFERMLTQTIQGKSKFKDMTGIEEDYLNPVARFTDKFHDTLVELKREIVSTVLEKLRNELTPNITIKEDIFQEAVKVSFDIFKVKEKFYEQYVKRNDELSLKEIKEKAKKLVPSFWESYNRRETKVEDILFGNALRLKKYVSDYGWQGHHSYSVSDYSDIISLVKLSKVILLRIEPSKVTANFNYSYRDEEIFNKVMVCQGVESYKIYKNGRLDVFCKSEEEARKVAEALCGSS